MTEEAEKNAAQNLGKQWLEALQKNEKFSKFENQYHLDWNTKSDVSRRQTGIDVTILDHLFRLAGTPEMKIKTPSRASFSLKNGDYVLLELTGIQEGDLKKLTPDQLKAYKEQLRQSISTLNYEFYVKSVLQKAKIKHLIQI